MARGRRGSKKPAQPKRIAYKLIDPKTDAGKPMYALLKELVYEHHSEVKDARFALAWNRAWKPDTDGRVILGKCKKASDLDRELAAFDFVIILRKDFWEDPSVTDAQRAALMDHELCHASVRCDKNSGEPMVDERNRLIYRIRKHDIEEFADIVERHGTYKRDLELFAQALRRGPQQGVLPVEVLGFPGKAGAEPATTH